MNAVSLLNLTQRTSPLIESRDDLFREFSIPDIISHLKETTYKYGYAPLNRSNPNWPSLRCEEISETIKELARKAKESVESLSPKTFFSQVSIISHYPLRSPALNEVTNEERSNVITLYYRIIMGKTPFTFEENAPQEFKDFILVNLQMLMTRPSGRLIIQSAIRSKVPICFKKSPVDSFATQIEDDLSLSIMVNYSTKILNPLCTLNENNILGLYYCPAYISIGHELIHILYNLSHISKIWEAEGIGATDSINLNKFLSIPSKDPAYYRMDELLVIEGLPGLPSENMLNYEFGLPPRYGHIGYNPFLPIAPTPENGLAFNQEGINEKIITTLILDNMNEFAFVYPFITPPLFKLCFKAAVNYGSASILQFLLDNMRELDNSFFIEMIRMAAAKDSRNHSLKLILTQIPDYVNYQDPQTGFTPLHLVSYANRPGHVRMLIQTMGADPFVMDNVGQTPCDLAVLSPSDTTEVLQNFINLDPTGTIRNKICTRTLTPGHPLTAQFIDKLTLETEWENSSSPLSPPKDGS